MEKYAIIDIGSNTIRLCIYEAYKDKNGIKYQLLLNMKESARLRNQVIDNKLTEVGYQKLKDVLRVYRAIILKDEIKNVRYIGTQAIRMVDNRQEILNRVKTKFDIDIDIITGEEEALLGFQGMNTFLAHEEEGVYVDLGGGSCEVVHFKDGVPLENYSFDFGSIVLRSMVDHAVPEENEIQKIETYLLNKFNEIDWLKNIKTPLVVVGGSARNMVRIDKFLTKSSKNVHGYRLDYRKISRIRKILMLLTLEEIELINGFTKSRADIIVSSIFVFEILFKYINAEYFVCARTGLREGVLVDMLEGQNGKH